MLIEDIVTTIFNTLPFPQRRAAVALKEGHFTKEIAPVSVKGRKGAVTEVSGYRAENPKVVLDTR